jgi:hypothetical protein
MSICRRSRLQIPYGFNSIIAATFLLAALSAFPTASAAQTIEKWNDIDCAVMKDQKYAGDDKNAFDIILPQSATPTPLIIYIHGGGFVQGDKNEAFRSRHDDIPYFLEHGVAFATVNYRFCTGTDSMGVNRCLKDIRTALQFIRHHAAAYNINKDLVACYGSSAGAGSSLYLAFHDDFAFENDTTLLGESTRIRCAGALATQATYNVFRWETFIPGLDSAMAKGREKFLEGAAHFYGYPTYQAFEPHRAAVARDLDMLEMISHDDPPTYIMNLQKEVVPKDLGVIEHHRAHAVVLSEYLQKNGVEHETYLYGKDIVSETDIAHPIREYLVEHLRQ